MSAYILFDIHDVSDPDGIAAYAAGAGPSIAAYGGKLLAANASPGTLEGASGLTSVALLEFPDTNSLHRWYESPEYGQWKPIRHRSSSADAVYFDGLPSDAT